jgi:excisionase family DNA binding protein
MTHEILTAQEVAEYLRIPEAEVDRLALAKVIPSIRVGDYVRFTRESLERWLGESTKQPATEVGDRSDLRLTGGGRNHSRLTDGGKCLEITLENPKTPLQYTLIPVQKNIRHFFPGYQIPFQIHADDEVVRTHVTSAAGNPKPGDSLAGHYIRGGLKGWFARHRKEIQPGVRLRIREVRAHKEYSLELLS